MKLESVQDAFCCISSSPADCSMLSGSVQCISKYRCVRRTWSEVQAESWYGFYLAVILGASGSALSTLITVLLKYKELRSGIGEDAGPAVGCYALCCSWRVGRAIEIAFRTCLVFMGLGAVGLIVFSLVALVTCK